MNRARRFLEEVFGRAGCLWIGGAAALGVLAWIVLAAAGLFLRPAAQPEVFPTPVLTIIYAPTETPTAAATVTAAPPTATATLPAASDGVIQVGDLVEVVGTSGDGLRLRSGPDLHSQILLLGVDSEVFQVNDGPVTADGFVWWYLVNPYDTAKQGWAVDTYLHTMGSP